MSNNKMIEYKESIISKIKKFFRNLFKIEKTYVSQISDLTEEEFSSSKKEKEFFSDLKVNTSDIDKFMNRNNFLKYIDGNVEALNLLSVDRLSKLKEYYDGVIEKNDKIIKQLKADN